MWVKKQPNHKLSPAIHWVRSKRVASDPLNRELIWLPFTPHISARVRMVYDWVCHIVWNNVKPSNTLQRHFKAAKKGCSGETRIDEFVFCDIRGAAHLPLIIVHNFGIKCLIRTQTSVCEYCLGRCHDGQIQPRRLETLGWWQQKVRKWWIIYNLAVLWVGPQPPTMELKLENRHSRVIPWFCES